MLPWILLGGVVVLAVAVVYVLRDAILDDRRRKLIKPRSNYSGY